MTRYGGTPLYTLVSNAGKNEKDIDKFFQLLIEHDAKPEAKNAQGRTPLVNYSNWLRNRLKRISRERLRATQQWIVRLKRELPADIVEHVILPLIHT